VTNGGIPEMIVFCELPEKEWLSRDARAVDFPASEPRMSVEQRASAAGFDAANQDRMGTLQPH